MALLTIFTPTYNRAHTLVRTYESLCRQTCRDFEWLVIDDGSTDGTKALVKSWQNVSKIKECGFVIHYIFKENGGLYTGYNTAYANIETELSLCIDSDDYFTDDAVEKIINCWINRDSDDYCGLVGLDFNTETKQPLGGFFPNGLTKAFFRNLKHRGDSRFVVRTSLIKQFAPMDGFPGEKDFNPHYMQMQVMDLYPVLLLNENLCWHEYQIGKDSMSEAIFKQYVRSPRSFAKQRLLEMDLKRSTMKDRFRCAVHYVSSCIIAKDKFWLKNAKRKVLVLFAAPLGLILSVYIKKKAI